MVAPGLIAGPACAGGQRAPINEPAAVPKLTHINPKSDDHGDHGYSGQGGGGHGGGGGHE